MAKTLVIVESPAKAKTIKKFLGSSYKVEATMGHIRDLPKSQLGIEVDKNYEPKYITIRGKGPILESIKKESKKVDRVLLATDPDREGEAISWHLANQLKIDDASKCRIEFNEITKNAVKNSLKNIRKIDKDLVDSQQARRILDRLVGYKISPLLWKKIRKGLSAGRVQSVATRLIVDRENEIQEFIPEEYWSIIALFHKKNNKKEVFEGKFYGEKNKKLDLKNQQQVRKILNDLKEEKYIIEKIKKSTKKRNPSPSFTTSSLQQEASRKLNFSSKKTMSIAQQLYEGINIKGEGQVGLITYVRTDSIRISKEAQEECRDFIEKEYGKNYLGMQEQKQNKGKKIQDAHEAIRPTSVNRLPAAIKDSLSRDQYKLYKLIWERFVASQMSPAIYNTMTVDIAAGKYIFRATGSQLAFAGYMSIYIEGKDNAIEEKDSILPDLLEGEELDIKKLTDKQHFTSPPPRYTEASLVKTLEEQGIGRPSTYAPTISTIMARGYVQRDKKNLMPTELGVLVTDLMKDYFTDIVDVAFTAELEKQLDYIEEGNIDWRKIIDHFYKEFAVTLKNAEEEIGDIEIKDEETDIPCEKCGRNMVIKHGRYGKFLACPGFPECRNTKPILKGTGAICPKCKGEIVEKKSKKGRLFYGCNNYPECTFMTWDKPSKKKCPECGSHLAEKGRGKNKILQCLNEVCHYTEELS